MLSVFSKLRNVKKTFVALPGTIPSMSGASNEV
jgi:hypothetical protein